MQTHVHKNIHIYTHTRATWIKQFICTNQTTSRFSSDLVALHATQDQDKRPYTTQTKLNA